MESATPVAGAPDAPVVNNVHGCALVFEGGGYRGAYTAGMVNLLLERGIYFDYACGLSAGASHTINYVSRDQTRVHMAFLAIDGNEPVGGMGSFLRGRGYFNADYLYEGCIRDGFCGFAWDTFCANPARIRIQAFEAAAGGKQQKGSENTKSVDGADRSEQKTPVLPARCLDRAIDTFIDPAQKAGREEQI